MHPFVLVGLGVGVGVEVGLGLGVRLGLGNQAVTSTKGCTIWQGCRIRHNTGTFVRVFEERALHLNKHNPFQEKRDRGSNCE